MNVCVCEICVNARCVCDLCAMSYVCEMNVCDEVCEVCVRFV